MIGSWLTPSYWNEIGKPDAWSVVLGAELAALATIVAVVVAAVLTYIYTRNHSVRTHNTEVRVDQLRRKIDALERVWSLLAYMSQQRSELAIIYWQRDRKNGGEKHYFFHFENLESFYLRKVSDVFYKHHAGLHLSKSIRDQVFTWLHSVAVLYFSHINDANRVDDGLIPIKSPELPEKLHALYEQLNHDLKEELKNCYQSLTIKT